MRELSCTVAERLAIAIENSGLSYAELEKRTGIAKSSIQRYVSGSTTKIPADAVTALGEATGISPAWIMGWDTKSNETRTTETAAVKARRLIGARIKELRLDRGYSQDSLAKALRNKYGLKTDRAVVGKWEIGYQTPEIYTTKCIADLLGVSLDYLTGSDVKEKQPANQSELSDKDKEIISLLADLDEDKRKEAINYIKYIAAQNKNKDSE